MEDAASRVHGAPLQGLLQPWQMPGILLGICTAHSYTEPECAIFTATTCIITLTWPYKLAVNDLGDEKSHIQSHVHHLAVHL